MKYLLSDIQGIEVVYNNLLNLKSILSQPFQYWEEGTGDSSIAVNEDERIVFFKLEEGVFIMQHPDYLTPLFDESKTGILVHYVGGKRCKYLKNFSGQRMSQLIF